MCTEKVPKTIKTPRGIKKPPERTQEADHEPKPPKKPPNSYMIFTKNRQKILKELHPILKPKEIICMIAKEWKILSETEKRDYQSEYLKLKTIYDTEIKIYKNSKNRMKINRDQNYS